MGHNNMFTVTAPLPEILFLFNVISIKLANRMNRGHSILAMVKSGTGTLPPEGGTPQWPLFRKIIPAFVLQRAKLHGTRYQERNYFSGNESLFLL